MHHASLSILCALTLFTPASGAAPVAGAATPDLGAARLHGETKSDLIDTAGAAGSFETLGVALQAAGLVDALRKEGPFTVFAPTDEAFAKLPKGTLELLLRPEYKERLTGLLTYHVVSGSVSAAQAVQAEAAATLQGADVSFTIESGRLRVSGATVLANDVLASNGVIHVIDTVLLPPGFGESLGRKIIGVYTERPSRALAEQLGLDRHASLLVTKLTADSTAAAAGLQRYDVITAIDHGPASDESLARAKEKRALGELIPIEVVRRGKTVHLDVAVGIERH